ncbi:MAG: HD domain-containing protein [Candidatus Micrarchaeota archaeon]
MRQRSEKSEHAHPKLCETILYKAASMHPPALEGLVKWHISERMLREEDRNRAESVSGLVKATAKRLAEMDGRKRKWTYTERHSLEVGYFSYIIASEAREQGITGSEALVPETCFAGGYAHDIGKTFLPLALVVKELGVDLIFFCLFEGHRLNDAEKRVLRDEHIAAGTRFVRLFGCDDGQVLHDMVGTHHVMFNGRGSMYPSYPANLVGNRLPLQSRIAKTADFLSAVLPRHYRADEWVHSMKDSIGYAIAVSGVELDPATVKCFMTGTHDISAEEADDIVARLRYPGSVSDIADFRLMKWYVRNTVEKDPGFHDMLERKARHRIMYYRDRIRECALNLGAPSLEDMPS